MTKGRSVPPASPSRYGTDEHGRLVELFPLPQIGSNKVTDKTKRDIMTAEARMEWDHTEAKKQAERATATTVDAS